MKELDNKATAKLEGKKAFLFEVGKDPIEVIINKIDTASGLIIEVLIKDENLETKILNVKDKVIVFLPALYRVWLMVKAWFKK
jgi:hypothetical protein